MNRSLRTDSPSLAVRLARKAAFETDAMFEGTRRRIGLGYDERLLVEQASLTSDGATISSRSARASAANIKPQTFEAAVVATPVLTLSDIYDRYIKDPTKRRSARTMLAHGSTRRVVEDVLGASTPISDITREQCRDLLETLSLVAGQPQQEARQTFGARCSGAGEAGRPDQDDQSDKPQRIHGRGSRR